MKNLKFSFGLTILAIFSSTIVIQSNPVQVQNATANTTNNTTSRESNRTLPIMQIKKPKVQIVCPYEPMCACNTTALDELILTCANFTNFNELNFKLSNNSTTLEFNSIRIIPLIVIFFNINYFSTKQLKTTKIEFFSQNP